MIDQSILNQRRNKVPVSIIIPFYDRYELFTQCIKSLLHQTRLPDEIIVVDNSREDVSSLMVKSFINRLSNIRTRVSIKYLKENHPGGSAARNKGFKTARNDLVAFIDEDCIPQKNWVKRILEASERHPDEIIQGTYVNTETNNLISSVIYFTNESFFQSAYLRDGENPIRPKFLDTKNFILRKSKFGKRALFDTHFTRFEDMDFSCKVRFNRIRIIRQNSIVVRHSERNTFFDFLKREFTKGINLYRFNNKWKLSSKSYKKIGIIFQKLHEDNGKIIERRLLNKILRNTSNLYRFTFNILLFIDRIIIKLGFYFEKLKTARIRTSIFLPRKVFIKTVLNHKGR